MKTSALTIARKTCFSFVACLCLLASACNQNHERIEEREDRDQAAKAAKQGSATEADTIVVQ